MEAAGFALGVFGAVGALGQLLDGCLKAYRIFTTATNLGRDSERLVVKIRIEEMRLKIWGREWGAAEGQLERNLSSLDISKEFGLRQLAQMILTELYQAIMDLNRLQDRYGLRESEPGSVDKEMYQKSKDPNFFSKANQNFKLKAKWVIGDKDKFNTFLGDLQDWNNSLEKLFPSTRLPGFRRTLASEMLQERGDSANLDLLESASQPTYPDLVLLSQLKQLRINLDATRPSNKVLSSSALKIQRWRIKAKTETTHQNRCRATYQRPLNVIRDGSASEDVDVFVEWTEFSSASSLDERLQLYQRVDNLARMLHSSSNRHPDLHTLDCLGYIEDAQESRYGLIYVHPPSVASTNLQTLATLIETLQQPPNLEIRFKIAHTLAVSVASCHALDWLHKTLCPENVIFFARDGAPDTSQEIGDPYLAGFDSSRPDHLDEMSRAPTNMPSDDWYRHPDSLGPERSTYCKAFDIYSLGLILLEIGLWKRLESFHKGKHLRYTRSELRDKIIQSFVPALGSKTGSRYRNVVVACLAPEKSDIGATKQSSPHLVMEGVLQILETLNV
ncbi:MAG: hypothetical protein M1828_001769 [Chrysothrix sp. TS-e1954]|nr:MAG: hypothetical protein M1828_001769 [Chrysothrix sp. TS-e1954]